MKTKITIMPNDEAKEPLGIRAMRSQISKRAAIVELVHSFPVLHRQFANLTEKNWHIDGFMDSASAVSTSARHAMLFIAGVWDASWLRSRQLQFDAIDAMSAWDREQRAAFIAWCQAPWWA